MHAPHTDHDVRTMLDVIGVNDVGGAVTIGLAHYSTMYEVDQLVRAVAELG